MTFLEKISAARVDVSDAQSALDRAEDALRKLLERRHFDEYGLRLGSIVTDGKVLIRVDHIRSVDVGLPWVSGKLVKKDGTVSRVVRHLYTDWRVVES